MNIKSVLTTHFTAHFKKIYNNIGVWSEPPCYTSATVDAHISEHSREQDKGYQLMTNESYWVQCAKQLQGRAGMFTLAKW